MKSLSCMRSLGLLAVAMGCSAEPDEYAPEFPEGTGRAPGTGVAYAPGPYGVSLGSVIADLPFVGFADPDAPDGLQLENATDIRLSDFYNPTGDEVFPEGSPYGEGVDKPTALLIVTSATWCGPCQYEAATILPANHAIYRPTGGEFILALQQGGTGEPATLRDVQGWASMFYLDYPAVADPPSRVFQYTGVGACPGMVMVRTKDMKIVRIRVGMVACADLGADPVSQADCYGLWETFEKVLADEPIAGVDD